MLTGSTYETSTSSMIILPIGGMDDSMRLRNAIYGVAVGVFVGVCVAVAVAVAVGEGVMVNVAVAVGACEL